jgi:dimethylaniline monooxygenase (N-oxide forming)
MKVAVVGGGPAGLATLKFLVTAHKFFPIPPVEVRLFEASPEIGGTFVHKVYEDAELVSSKYLTAFSDFRLPLDAPDFLTPGLYVQYLRDYAASFKLERFIECQTKVIRARRGDGKIGHVLSLSTADGQTSEWECDAIAVCSGLNGIPRIPKVPGIERVPVVLHSSQVKTRQQFGHDTNVVVLGVGETGMDMAHLAVTSPTKSVTVCHRDGFFCGPKVLEFVAAHYISLRGSRSSHPRSEGASHRRSVRINQSILQCAVCLTRHTATRSYREVLCLGLSMTDGSKASTFSSLEQKKAPINGSAR